VPAPDFQDISYAPPGGARIFERFSLAIERGEVVALVGRSGAGKTTLLKLVNRLLTPDSGRVIVLGRDTREWDPIRLRRSTGYVIQDVGLFPHMTVEENIAVVPRLDRWEDGRVRERVAELLDLVGLTSAHASRRPHQLSGGQRQRVGVARALAADPPVLLMDEPFGALDPITRRELQGEFRRIQQRLHKTVILVTHDMTEALMLADRVAVLDHGVLVAFQTADAIRRSRDPRDRQLLDTVLLSVQTES
jgi:osmoprotectant transport system ATP-binding protein